MTATNINDMKKEKTDLYAKLATYTTLTGDAKTKSNLIANIYKNYTTLIDMIGIPQKA